MVKYTTCDNIVLILSILLIILLLIDVFNYILYNTINDKLCYSFNTHIYKSKKQGDTILIIGSVHGNEPAGYFTLNILRKALDNKKIKINKGKLILIPNPNYCGLLYNKRNMPGFGSWTDINRSYPTNINSNSRNIVSKQIINLIKIHKPGLIIDLHEAYSFNKINKYSAGQTLSFIGNNAESLSKLSVKNLNNTITDINKKYSSINITESKQHQFKGTLSYYSKINKYDYILVETAGQNNIQKLKDRIQQQLLVLLTTINNKL